MVMICVSPLKIFKMNLIFFNFFASACPHFSLSFFFFFTLSNRKECTVFRICVCWLRGITVIFLSHWGRKSLTRTSSEFASIVVHSGWLIIKFPFQKGQTGKETSLQLCNAHMGKLKPLCLCCFSKQWKIHPLRGGRTQKPALIKVNIVEIIIIKISQLSKN